MVSVFSPWADGGYAVANVPEAVWFVPNDQPELLYLGHTHVPTIWEEQQVTLDALEWTRKADGSLALPNALCRTRPRSRHSSHQERPACAWSFASPTAAPKSSLDCACKCA